MCAADEERMKKKVYVGSTSFSFDPVLGSVTELFELLTNGCFGPRTTLTILSYSINCHYQHSLHAREGPKILKDIIRYHHALRIYLNSLIGCSQKTKFQK